MKPPTVFGLREQGAMLLAVERLAKPPAPPIKTDWLKVGLRLFGGAK